MGHHTKLAETFFYFLKETFGIVLFPQDSQWTIPQSSVKLYIVLMETFWHCFFKDGLYEKHDLKCFPMDHPTKFGEALYCFNGDLLTLFFQRWPLWKARLEMFLTIGKHDFIEWFYLKSQLHFLGCQFTHL